MLVEGLCIIKNHFLNIRLLQDTAHCCVAIPYIPCPGNGWNWPGSPAPQHLRMILDLKCSSPRLTQRGNLHLFSQEKPIPGNCVSHKGFAEQSDPTAVPVKLLHLLPFTGRGFPLLAQVLTCINCLNPILLQFKLNTTVSLENMAYFLLLVSF